MQKNTDNKLQPAVAPSKAYTKPHLPIPLQVQLLISRGLSVPDAIYA